MRATVRTHITRTTLTLRLGTALTVARATFHSRTSAMRATVRTHLAWATLTLRLGTALAMARSTLHARTRTLGAGIGAWTRSAWTARGRMLWTAWSAAKTCLHLLVCLAELVLRDAAVSIGVDACEDLVRIGHPPGRWSRPTTLWASAGWLRLGDGAQGHNDGSRGDTHPNRP